MMKFQTLLAALKKEKQDNYVNSFQSVGTIAYGIGYTSQSEEKRVLDILNFDKQFYNKTSILHG